MLNITQHIGFGAGGDEVPPITYANTWGISNNSSASTIINDVNLLPGTKTLVFGIMQHDNGSRLRQTTGVDVSGATATLRAAAENGQEYRAHMSFWEVETSLDQVDITIFRNAGGGTHGMGVARMWVFNRPLGVPSDTLALIYTTRNGTIDKYQGGVTLALANSFNGSGYVSGVANNTGMVWVNLAAYEIPLSTTTDAPISYGVVTQYYNQMALVASWAP